MNIEISYNKGSLNLNLPDRNIMNFIRPETDKTRDAASVINRALNRESLDLFIDSIKIHRR